MNSRDELMRLSKHRLGNIQGYTEYEEESTLFGEITSQSYHIYILSNLHKVVFNAVLAHELLHTWLYDNQINLSPLAEEGFCNLGRYIIYNNLRIN